jgi:hypothetical protein
MSSVCDAMSLIAREGGREGGRERREGGGKKEVPGPFLFVKRCITPCQSHGKQCVLFV